MKQIVLSLAMLFAFVPAGFAADPTTASADNPMAGWVPRKVTKEQQDKKEIAALFKAMHDAGQKGDVQAGAALVDFPVLMVTDDAKGEAKTESWDKEKWVQVMAPFYKPHPNVKMTHKPTVFLLTDSLASVTEQWTMTEGKKTTSGRSAMLLVRKEGEWRIKSMAEGGWGDTMAAKPATASQPTEPSGQGTAAQPTQPSGTGTTTSEPQGTGTQPTK